MELVLGLLLAFCRGDDKELVNKESGFVVVEQKRDKIIFYDPILEAEMRETGVVIPLKHQEKYGGRERIKLGDEQFAEAFDEFYAPYRFSDGYQWMKLDS